MRIAIFSDIHGNLVSLDAVLADIRRQGIQQMVCLGDVAATGPQPRDVLARLQKLAIPIVQGNTDEWLLAPELWGQDSEFYTRIYEIEQWGADLLTEADKEFLGTFQATVEIKLDETQSLFCFHGSPKGNRDIIRATTETAVLDDYFSDTTAKFLAGGHTHQALLRRHEDKLIINPGSVGMPYIQMGEKQWIPPWA